MRADSTRSILVQVTPESKSDVDEIDLATELEKVCFLDPALEGAYRRHFVKTAREPLGLSWTGILEFSLKAKDQIGAFCKAILTAFAGSSVKVRIRSGDKQLQVEARNAKLPEVRRIVEALCESVEKMQ